ncbi:MAG: hypothetical protein KIT25_02925 [Enhydrobacter sp.]|nr:MAG: hypothetical protein KIT25_02925 [Enhydrobacter sp.]
MIAPLSLANLATIVFAALCFSTISPQAKGAAVRYWRLAVPASLAMGQALVMLAGIFDVTLASDLVWVAAAFLGGLLGRMRGWSTPITIDPRAGLVRQSRAFDSAIVAALLVVLAAVDFVSAALQRPLMDPDWVAAGAAFCAGFLCCRALATVAKAERQQKSDGAIAGASD